MEATQGTQATEKQKSLKWHQKEGAVIPFAAGVKTKVIAGNQLLNRLVEVTGPADKEGKTKGYLLHQKTGLPQKTHITMDYANLELYVEEAPAAEAKAEAI